jgi:hypothetical protein
MLVFNHFQVEPCPTQTSKIEEVPSQIFNSPLESKTGKEDSGSNQLILLSYKLTHREEKNARTKTAYY